MKCTWYFLAIAAACLMSTSSAMATVLVNDTWQDGERDSPASPTYSEAGTDSDLDGDLESAWFGSSGTLAASTGHLTGTNGSGSASWTTYFTPDSSPVTLANDGDQLKITWVFTPNGITTNNTSQNFRMAVVDTPSAARLAADGNPGSDAYTGYGMFMNMGPVLGNGNPFRLVERLNASGALLSASGEWGGLANGATSGNNGYVSGTEYTFMMTLTRNGSSLDITSSMTGGQLDGDGEASLSFNDPTPNGFTYDTFSLRPSNAITTADNFDTTLFKVEFTAGVPEPASLSLLGMSALALVLRRRS